MTDTAAWLDSTEKRAVQLALTILHQKAVFHQSSDRLVAPTGVQLPEAPKLWLREPHAGHPGVLDANRTEQLIRSALR